ALVLWWYGRITSGPGSSQSQPAVGTVDHERSPWRVTLETSDDRRGWMTLAGLLIAGGLLGPDSLGTAHGEFLPQRVILLGLVALVPIFDVKTARWPGRAVAAMLAVAVMLQAVIVWDYGRYANRTAGQIICANELVGRNQRIVT